MYHPPTNRVRVLVDYNGEGDLIQVGYQVWAAGELVATGTRPVGPFDRPAEIEQWVIAHAGLQLALDLT